MVPNALGELMSKGNADQKGKVVAAFMKMKKFDVAGLEAAFNS